MTDRPATEPRPTTRTFEQVNRDNAEQETWIGALQEMVAILLNRLDEAGAASPAALDVEGLREAMADEAFYIEDDEGNMLPYDEAARRLVARLSRSAGEQTRARLTEQEER